MRNKVVLVLGTSFSVVTLSALIGWAFADKEPAEAVQTESTCMPAPCFPPAWTPSETTTPSVAPQVSTHPSLKPVAAHKPAPTTTTIVTQKTTTTLTQRSPELEKRIPGGEIDTEAEYEFCEATGQPLGDCDLPETEGMGEDPPMDWSDQQ